MTTSPEFNFQETELTDIPRSVQSALIGHDKPGVYPGIDLNDPTAVFRVAEYSGFVVHVATTNSKVEDKYEPGGFAPVVYSSVAHGIGSDVSGRGLFLFRPLSQQEYFCDKPLVVWTETAESHRRTGMGKMRFELMNRLAIMIHQRTLHSSTVFAHASAKRIWESLVLEGLAEDYEQKLRNFKTGELLTTAKRFKFKP